MRDPTVADYSHYMHLDVPMHLSTLTEEEFARTLYYGCNGAGSWVWESCGDETRTAYRAAAKVIQDLDRREIARAKAQHARRLAEIEALEAKGTPHE